MDTIVSPAARRRAAGIRYPVLAAAVFMALLPGASTAQSFPARTVRIVVPQSAGGSTDVVARIIAQRLAEALGQPVIVDNRPGAGSVTGTELVAKSPPDGHTLLSVAGSFTINPAIRRNLPFDPVKDFAAVTLAAVLPHVLVVHPSVPAQSVKELIALLKARPGEINYASSGIATSTHMAAELFRHMTGTNMVNVPYKGGAPAMVAMIVGECQVNFATISTALPRIRAGKLRPLGVTTAKRSSAAPEYPTLAEAGVRGYNHSSWVGFLAPAGTPAAVISRLQAETAKIVQSPEVKSLLLRDGLEAAGETPQEFGGFIRDEIARWTKVVKAAGIRAD
ncbi:MAG: tripartite tricarboxylate transporter substrate binding protein [Burkholderiales bacterium]|nr:tripartite tricarboxylate transporter substrate binding protein [Burkholderiales bacterium]